MGTHEITELQVYLHDQADDVPTTSPRWLFINFIEELTDGVLAYRELTGEIEKLDEILDHRFWVFGLLHDAGEDETNAYYHAFKREDGQVSEPFRRLLARAIMQAYGHRTDALQAAKIMDAHSRHTIAAVSVGAGPEGEIVSLLYWNPYFTQDVAVGILQETVSMYEAL